MSSNFTSSIAFADTSPNGNVSQIGEFTPSEFSVMSFAGLPDGISVQNLKVGDAITNIVLPDTLTGYYQSGEQVSISPVTWTINKPFNNNVVDTYTYTPVLPVAYEYNPDIATPTISVSVNKAATVVLDMRHTITQTAGITLGDQLRIHPAYGRSLYIQKYNPSTKKWGTKKTYVLSDVYNQKLTIYYPREWYSLNQVTTIWRIYLPGTGTGSSYISPSVTINAMRAYQNPIGYYQIQPGVTLRSNAGYTLRYGSMGLKVALVQHKLGLGDIWEIIGPSTYEKIKAYQKSKGLAQTGNVDYSLWKRLGFSDYSWYYRAAYVSPMRTNLASSKDQLIESFIANAYSYLGTEYIVGAAGKPDTGVDCSGLVMQSMYATGVDPYPISVIRHSQPGYEYESRNFWASSQMKTVATTNRVRGDLIFYQNQAGVVIHVAIYLGNNKVIESVPSGVRVSPLIGYYPNIKGVKRVFN